MRQKTVIYLSLMQLVGCLWVGEQLEVCFSKPKLFLKKYLSPDHPSVSIFIQLFTSFLPLTFALSHSTCFPFNFRARKGRERAMRLEYTYTWELKINVKNNHLSHRFAGRIQMVLGRRTTCFIHQSCFLMIFFLPIISYQETLSERHADFQAHGVFYEYNYTHLHTDLFQWL